LFVDVRSPFREDEHGKHRNHNTHRTRRHRRSATGQRHQDAAAVVDHLAALARALSPRWLVHLLQWVPVESGIYRVNKVTNATRVEVACGNQDESAELPQTFVDYEPRPREYFLNTVSTILDVHTRISDLYSVPHDQIKEQLRLTIETVKERQEGELINQEGELINNSDYGLISNVDPAQRISTRTGAPQPDDLDNLITKVWKEPAFFLTHPLAIAAFGRECTRRGVPPPTVCHRRRSVCSARSS